MFNARLICSSFHSFLQYNLDTEQFLAAYHLLWTLRKLSVRGGDSGRQAVLDASTDDLRRILPHIGEDIRRFYGDALARETEYYIAETW